MLIFYIQKHKTTLCGTVSTLVLFIAGAGNAFALSRIDELTGVNQTFTRGYDYRRFSEASSNEATYELFVPDEKKKELEAKEQEEEKKSVDLWRYSRSMTVTSIYDSNYESARQEPKGEFEWVYNPNFGMSHRTEHTFVNLFYDMAYSSFVEAEKLTTLRHTQLTQLGYTFGRLSLQFSNTVQPFAAYDTAERTELENTTAAVGSPERRRVIALSDNFVSTATFRVSPKTTAGLSYERDLFYIPTGTHNNTLVANNNSFVTHAISPTLVYRWTPKTAYRLGYVFTKADYFEPGGDKTSFTHAISAGVSTRLFARNYLSFNTGFSHRDYEASRFDSVNSLNWAVTLSRKLTQKIGVSLSTTRAKKENFDGTGTQISEDETFYGVDFRFQMSPKVAFALGGSAGFVESGGFVTRTDLDNPTLTFTRPLETEIYEWYATLGWQLRPFISTTLGYQYTNSNASFKDLESEDHKMLGSVNARF